MNIIVPAGLAEVATQIADKLVTLRVEFNIRRVRLASISEVPEEAVSGLEAGDTGVCKSINLPLDVLLDRICRALSTTIDAVVPRLVVSDISEPDRECLLGAMHESGWFCASASNPADVDAKALLDKQIEVFAFYQLIEGLSEVRQVA